MQRYRFRVLAVLAVLVVCLPASAATIGQWSGSSRSWNSGDMATVKAAMIAAGHTVTANQAITAPNLAADGVFLIGEALVNPSGAELALVQSWVTGGGILIMMFDSGCSGCASGNYILSGIGSTMSASGSASGTLLAGGIFATTGPP